MISCDPEKKGEGPPYKKRRQKCNFVSLFDRRVSAAEVGIVGAFSPLFCLVGISKSSHIMHAREEIEWKFSTALPFYIPSLPRRKNWVIKALGNDPKRAKRL